MEAEFRPEIRLFKNLEGVRLLERRPPLATCALSAVADPIIAVASLTALSGSAKTDRICGVALGGVPISVTVLAKISRFAALGTELRISRFPPNPKDGNALCAT